MKTSAKSLSWEKSYPDRLRSYRLEDSALPSPLNMLATHGRHNYGQKTAATLVLPNGLSIGMSYEEIDQRADWFAAYVGGTLGLQLGEVVAIQLPNSLHYPVAVFGCWRAGLIVTNVNPLYTERELEDQVRSSGAKLLVAHCASLATASKVAAAVGIPVIAAGLWEFFPSQPSAAIQAAMTGGMSIDTQEQIKSTTSFAQALSLGRAFGPIPEKYHPVALYQYTGGTTGKSKGAVLTHENLASALQMSRDFNRAFNVAFETDDVILTVIPLYHIFAFVINFLSFYREGAHNILVPNPRPLTNLQPAFEKFQPTWMTGVDTLYAGLLAESWFHSVPKRLKFSVGGGTATRQWTAEKWTSAVCPLLEGYGMTESSCIISFNPEGLAQRPGSAGLPMPGSEIRIVDSEGQEVALGERGELQVRGPHITSGYLNASSENDKSFSDGWFKTGDIVTMDADGWISIVDRLKDMVLVSGFNVYPNEIEGVLATHPDVLEAAVVGVPDDTTGEAVRAFVVSKRADLTDEELEQFCRKQLTAYKVPKYYVFKKQLPKSPVGKILRALLRE